MNKKILFTLLNQVSGGWCSVIGGGRNNFVTTPNTSVPNPQCSILGGNANCIYTFNNAVIAGGSNNVIGNITPATTDVADYGFIGAGASNLIDSTGACSFYDVIGGGQQNKVCAGAFHSGIFGGHNNCVAGSCSAIMGGANNSDGGLNNVFIAGSGIGPLGLIPSALHINALWANGLPTYPGTGPGYITGTVFILPVGNTPPVGAQGVLWIM